MRILYTGCFYTTHIKQIILYNNKEEAKVFFPFKLCFQEGSAENWVWKFIRHACSSITIDCIMVLLLDTMVF